MKRFLKEKAVFMIFVLICAIFTIQLIQPVKAESKVCCEKTVGTVAGPGEYCVYTEPGNCDSNYENSPVACEQTTYCGTGCCVVDGDCDKNTPKSTCFNFKGAWYPGIECDIPRCQIGCCALPGGCSVVEEAVCAEAIEGYEALRLADVFNPSVNSELQCQQECLSMEEGCCVSTDVCKFTSRKDCNNNFAGSQFFKNTICSSRPDCRVTGQHHTGCLPGRDGVYWFDSAGNRENIYGTDYDPNGLVIPKEESCDPPLLSSGGKKIPNPDCGNCDYSKGSTCAEADGAFLARVPSQYEDKVSNMCISLDCEDTIKSDKNSWMKGQPRKNAESWCEYEGSVGDGKDLVGSMHYRHLCEDGIETIEPCDERRESICVQKFLPDNVVEGGLDAALCRPNLYGSCIACNSEEYFSKYELNESEKNKIDCGGECNLLCQEDYWAGTDRDKCEVDEALLNEIWKDEDGNAYRKELEECCDNQALRKKCCSDEMLAGDCYWDDDVGLCAPEFPPGTSDTCFGEFTCTEVWKKTGAIKDWWCIENCDHSSQALSEGYKEGRCNTLSTEWNNYCRSLGDCGAHFNIEGEYTSTGFSSGGPDPAELNGLVPFVELEDPEDLEKVKFDDFNSQDEPIEGKDIFSLAYSAGLAYSIKMPELAHEFAWDVGDFFAAFWFLGATLAATFIVSLAVEGLTFGVAVLEMATFGAYAATAKEAITPALSAVLEPLGVVLFWVGVAWLILCILFFCGEETQEVTYTFTCGPWEPPNSANDCEKCMTEYSKCTEYKCESLGAFCKPENQNGEIVCLKDENINDVTPPIIEPLPILPRDGSTFIKTPVSSGRMGGYEFDPAKDIIPVYTPLKIGVKTLGDGGNGEYAKCKISRFHKDYDEMTEPFGDLDVLSWAYEHEMTIPVAYEAIPADEDRIEITPGQLNTFYVRCENRNERANDIDYFIKFTVEDSPDTQAPVLEDPKFSILNNAYIPYGTTEIKLSIYLNEPADPLIGGCKYSTTSNQNYKNMPNNFDCSPVATYQNLYPCTTTLTGLQNNKDNVFYFKCRDKNNNINRDDIPAEGYHLRGSIPLEITDSGPSGTVYSNIGEVELTVKTKEGAEKDGSSTCYYNPTGFFNTPMIIFSNTGLSSVHSTIAPLDKGSQKIYTWCRDLAGNEDTVKIEFVLESDSEAPEIIKLYEDISTTPSMLHVSTDEPATCQYSTEGRFNFGTGIDMSVSETTEHEAEWGSTVYYVLCQDRFNNLSPLTIIYP